MSPDRYAASGGFSIHPVLAPALSGILLVLALPAAWAGTPEAPELTDPADDCGFPPGNHYADIVAAWVSDETPTHFNVNIALSKWTADALAIGTGYTLQFSHQGVQFGVVAFYGGAVFGGWSYSNGYVDVETGELQNFTDAEGSFTPGSPAVLTIAFDKAHFPHKESADDKLVAFKGGTADFKPPIPVWVAEDASGQDVPAEPDYLDCDIAESSATYTFGTGGHSAHGGGGATGGGSGNETAPSGTGAANGTAPESATPARAAPDAAGDKKDTPFVAPAALVAVLAVLALRRRR